MIKGSNDLKSFHILDSLNDFVRPIVITGKESSNSSSTSSSFSSIPINSNADGATTMTPDKKNEVSRKRSKTKQSSSSNLLTQLVKELTSSKAPDGSKAINNFKIIRELGDVYILNLNIERKVQNLSIKKLILI